MDRRNLIIFLLIYKWLEDQDLVQEELDVQEDVHAEAGVHTEADVHADVEAVVKKYADHVVHVEADAAEVE